MPFCKRRQWCQSSILIKTNQKPILKSPCVYISVNSDVVILSWCRQQLKGGSDGERIYCCTSQASVISPPRQRCAPLFMSFTDVQYAGTQVQVNQTEWIKWTKIVFFQRVWLLEQQMSVLMLESSVRWNVTDAMSTSYKMNEWMPVCQLVVLI